MSIKTPLKSEKIEKQLLSSRLLLLTICMLIGILILIARLTHLQIIEYDRYKTLSNNNQLGVIPLAPPRGLILDRNGIVLAENIPVYTLEIIPEHVKSLDDTLKNLQTLLPSISQEDVENFVKAKQQNRSFDSVPLKYKLSAKEVALFAVNKYRFNGVNIKARLMRNYPLGKTMAHVLGYVGRINQQEINHLDKTNYRTTNFIGKVGIEKYYEQQLHGRVGYQQVEIDATGRTISVTKKTPPIPGDNLYLSIDSHLQKVTEDAMSQYRGAVVAIDPMSGEVLAMVSMPSYDPNVFVRGISAKDYQALSQSPKKPLYNRSIRGQYPPASTIKPFIALGGLDNNVITPSYKIYDKGWYKLPNTKHIYRDWKRGGHGWISLNRAITVSCDTYFYQLANLMGIRRIEDILVQFGFGQTTHIDMGEELVGLLPNKQWKINNKKSSWYKGDTLITGIGQGFMLATPLQLANATAALGMKGKHYRAHLLLKSEKPAQDQVKVAKRFEEYPITLKSPNNWNIIEKAMVNVVKSREGTGFRFGRNSPYSIAAKTGTAQVFSTKQYTFKSYQDTPENLRDHSLFIGYAPIDHPQIAIAVLVENDYIASNIARKVLDAFFKDRKI